MIKCCVFDLDGTLVDSLDDLATSMNYSLELHGFPVHDRESYKQYVGDGVKMLTQRSLPASASALAEALVLKEFNAYYDAHYLDQTKPYEGIPDVLSALGANGVKCCVLTNKPDNFARQLVDKLFGETLFSMVTGQSDRFPKKPDPKALFFMLEQLGVNPDECLYIGDSNVDMRTGKNAGIKTIGVLWGFRGQDELQSAGADFMIDNPGQIIDIMRNINAINI